MTQLEKKTTGAGHEAPADSSEGSQDQVPPGQDHREGDGHGQRTQLAPPGNT